MADEEKSSGTDTAGAGEGAAELIDLQRRKLARELEREFAGLFGIDVRDVEKALERMGTDAAETRLPAPVERCVRLLEAVQEIARDAAEQDDERSLHTILELLDNYRKRLGKLLE